MEERLVDMPEEIEEQKQEAAPAKYSLGGGVGAFLAMGAVDLFAHLGPTGLVVAAIVGIAAYRHAPEVLEQIGKEVPLPKRAPKRTMQTMNQEDLLCGKGRSALSRWSGDMHDRSFEQKTFPLLPPMRFSAKRNRTTPLQWSVSRSNRPSPTLTRTPIRSLLAAH